MLFSFPAAFLWVLIVIGRPDDIPFVMHKNVSSINLFKKLVFCILIRNVYATIFQTYFFSFLHDFLHEELGL